MAGAEPAPARGEPVLPGGRGMSNEAGGSRSLKSLGGLISTTLVCLVLSVAAWVGAWLLGLDLLYAVAGVLALATAIPLFLMFQRVQVVESDFGHREALSLAQRKETARNQAANLRLLDKHAPLTRGDRTLQAT